MSEGEDYPGFAPEHDAPIPICIGSGDLDGEVDPSGTGHETPERRARQKLGIVDPAPALDDFAIEPARGAAPETHHAQAEKGCEYRQ